MRSFTLAALALSLLLALALTRAAGLRSSEGDDLHAAPAVAQPAPAIAPRDASPEALIAELGCAGCHVDLPASRIGGRAPALGDAGLRYEPAFLYRYLRDPWRVRRHIGASRMPDFGFSERESLALALYLSGVREDGENRPERPGGLRLPFGRRGDPGRGGRLVQELGCTGCHTLDGRGGGSAPELAMAAARLRPDWIERYLVNPAGWDPGTPMPSIFHDPETRAERMPDAGERIRDVVAHLEASAATRRAGWDEELDAARERYPEVDAELGRRIFLSQNCAGCHTRAPARAWPNAPDLSAEGSRVRPEWLRAFLAEPAPVRPFGFYPGSGSRMPDFELTPEEVEVIASFLLSRTRPLPGAGEPPAPPLSAYSARKAETLLREKLPCLGCHVLEGEGGRIGPDLTGAAARLRPEWIRAMVTDPQHTQARTIMPRVPMPDDTRELVIRYLQGRDDAPPPSARLSLVEHPIHFPAGGSPARADYSRFCASCHGAAGEGRGYNARYLPRPATAHASAERMSERPDDTLYDGIHAGGAVLGRSHRMPAFGQTLPADRIRALVAYIRDLCECVGPAWSRDGARGEDR